jgi:hypothetical protein
MAKIVLVCLNPAKDSPRVPRGLLGYAKRLRRFLGRAKRQADCLTANNPNFFTLFFDVINVFKGVKELTFLEGGIVTDLATATHCMDIYCDFIHIYTRIQARWNLISRLITMKHPC